MTLVKVGRREAVFRVAITTAEGTSTHLVLAGDPVSAGNRAARELGFGGHRRYAITGMKVEQLTEKLAPAAAQRELQRLKARPRGAGSESAVRRRRVPAAS
jgi:hypothetical protein